MAYPDEQLKRPDPDAPPGQNDPRAHGRPSSRSRGSRLTGILVAVILILGVIRTSKTLSSSTLLLFLQQLFSVFVVLGITVLFPLATSIADSGFGYYGCCAFRGHRIHAGGIAMFRLLIEPPRRCTGRRRGWRDDRVRPPRRHLLQFSALCHRLFSKYFDHLLKE